MAKRGNPNWKKGKSGNLKGRPPLGLSEAEQFRNAISEVEKEQKKSLYKHAIEQAFKDRAVLIAVLNKKLPTKIESEGGPIPVIILPDQSSLPKPDGD